MEDLVLICFGNYDDPEFHKNFPYFVKKLDKMLSQGQNTLLIHKKTEKWNSVRVTFSINSEAADRLRHLAQVSGEVLARLGILSVQLPNGQVISVRSNNPATPPNVVAPASSALPPAVRESAVSGTATSNPGSSSSSNPPATSNSGGAGVPMMVQSAAVTSESCNTPRQPVSAHSQQAFPFSSMAQASAIVSNQQNKVLASGVASSTQFSTPHYQNESRLEPPRTSPLLVNLLQNDQTAPVSTANEKSAFIRPPASNANLGLNPIPISTPSKLHLPSCDPPAQLSSNTAQDIRSTPAMSVPPLISQNTSSSVQTQNIPETIVKVEPSSPPPRAEVLSSDPLQQPPQPQPPPPPPRPSPSAVPGKSVQYLINPLTGVLEPALTSSDSDSEQESSQLPPLQSRSPPPSISQQSKKSPPIQIKIEKPDIIEDHHPPISSSSKITSTEKIQDTLAPVCQQQPVVKAPASSVATQVADNSTATVATQIGVTVSSATPSEGNVNSTSNSPEEGKPKTEEKIKLRLKLPGTTMTVESSSPTSTVTSLSLSGSSSSNSSGSSSSELRVPPLHISLRGRPVVLPSRKEKKKKEISVMTGVGGGSGGVSGGSEMSSVLQPPESRSSSPPVTSSCSPSSGGGGSGGGGCGGGGGGSGGLTEPPPAVGAGATAPPPAPPPSSTSTSTSTLSSPSLSQTIPYEGTCQFPSEAEVASILRSMPPGGKLSLNAASVSNNRQRKKEKSKKIYPRTVPRVEEKLKKNGGSLLKSVVKSASRIMTAQRSKPLVKTKHDTGSNPVVSQSGKTSSLESEAGNVSLTPGKNKDTASVGSTAEESSNDTVVDVSTNEKRTDNPESPKKKDEAVTKKKSGTTEEDDLIPLRVTPALYTYSNPERQRDETPSPENTEEERFGGGESLILKQLLVDVPNSSDNSERTKNKQSSEETLSNPVKRGRGNSESLSDPPTPRPSKRKCSEATATEPVKPTSEPAAKKDQLPPTQTENAESSDDESKKKEDPSPKSVQTESKPTSADEKSGTPSTPGRTTFNTRRSARHAEIRDQQRPTRKTQLKKEESTIVVTSKRRRNSKEK